MTLAKIIALPTCSFERQKVLMVALGRIEGPPLRRARHEPLLEGPGDR
jgi:hypothetical protein